MTSHRPAHSQARTDSGGCRRRRKSTDRDHFPRSRRRRVADWICRGRGAPPNPRRKPMTTQLIRSSRLRTSQTQSGEVNRGGRGPAPPRLGGRSPATDGFHRLTTEKIRAPQQGPCYSARGENHRWGDSRGGGTSQMHRRTQVRQPSARIVFVLAATGTPELPPDCDHSVTTYENLSLDDEPLVRERRLRPLAMSFDFPIATSAQPGPPLHP